MYFIRFAVLCTACFCIAFFSLNAQPEKVITVGKQPVKIIPHGNNVHVFCAQTDADYDNEKDEGDTPASWHILEATTGNIISSLEFTWNGTGYASTPALDTKNNILYCNDKNRVMAFNAITQEVIKDTVFPSTGVGLAVNSGGNLLAITIRPNFTDPGKVIYMNLENGDTTIQLRADVNVRQPLFYEIDNDNRGLIVLNEGLFSTESSWLHIWTLTSAETKRDSILVGNTGNHVFIDGNNAYVTVNGSHEVKIVDIKTKRIIDSINTETTGINGPRESIKIDNELFVTTFEGDVRRFSLTTKQLMEKFIPNGKPEGLAQVGERIWIADAFEKGQFSAQSTISVWNYLLPVSVEESVAENDMLIMPHPVHSYCTVNTPFTGNNPLRIKLYSVNGEIYEMAYTEVGNSGGKKIALDVGTLQSGTYSLHISSDIRTISLPLVIVK